MAVGIAGNDLERLTVTGVLDGVPVVVVWEAGTLLGSATAVAAVRDYALLNKGEFLAAHPEGGAFPVGLDHYEEAWVTVPEALDTVSEVEGIDPSESVDDDPYPAEDDSDTTREMAARWTPGLHPRWPRGTPKGGKFMTKGEIAAAKKAGGPKAVAGAATPSAASAAKANAPAPPRVPAGAGPTRLKEYPPLPVPKAPDSKGAVETGDVKEAAALLAQGKAVRLKSTRQVSMLLDELARVVSEMEAKGEKAPDYNLCKITVKNTNLFCVETQGWPRDAMPQLKGKPEKGSRAFRMKQNPDDPDEEVDLTHLFLEHLEKAGYKLTDGEENAAYLKASQNELSGGKVSGMVKWMRGGGNPNATSRMMVSEDNYIVDGHHRWAATVGLDAEDGRLGNDKKIPITRVDIDIIRLLREAVLFTNNMGIPNAGWKQPSGPGPSASK